MIVIKNKQAIAKMKAAGAKLASIFSELPAYIIAGVSTLEIDSWIARQLQAAGLVSRSLGYRGYAHSSCISVNDVVIHGIPHHDTVVTEGDLITVDVCASWKGYCADMARSFVVGSDDSLIESKKALVAVAQNSLDLGISQVHPGGRFGDVSAAIQEEVERNGCSVIRDFAGHGIGKNMHEEPEILNYGSFGTGPLMREGMAFAIEPMIAAGNYQVYVTDDGWTVKTVDKSLAAHVEDTVVVTENGPEIITRSTEG